MNSPFENQDWRSVLASALPKDEVAPTVNQTQDQGERSRPRPESSRDSQELGPKWSDLLDPKLPSSIPGPLESVENILAIDPGGVNFTLLFHRYLPQVDPQDKPKLLRFLLDQSQAYFSHEETSRTLDGLRRESQLAVAGVSCSGPVTCRKAIFQEHLAMGLGNASAFDNGLTLHHLLGVPYIPASAIKGIARHMAFESIASEYGVPFPENGSTNRNEPLALFRRLIESPSIADGQGPVPKPALREHEKSTFADLQEKLPDPGPLKGLSSDDWGRLLVGNPEPTQISAFRIMFGVQSSPGGVMFSDAFPTAVPQLRADLVNPHHGRDDDHPPADYFNPVPAYFLTVKKGTEFEFVTGWRRNLEHIDYFERCLSEWLDESFSWGIGSKTQVGYGAANVKEKPWE